MSNQDEFESLIRNFKLDDVQEPQNSAGGAQRSAFDFEADKGRYEPTRRQPEQPLVRQPIRQSEQPARQPAYQTAQRQQPARGPVRPAMRSDGPVQGGKKNFRVNIDDDDFYESNPQPPRGGKTPPPSGGGGGRRGGGNDEDDGEVRGGSTAGRWLKALIALAIVLCLSGFLALFALDSASDLFGLNQPDEVVEFVLKDNLSLSEVAAQLEDDGVITQPLVFRLFAELKKKGRNEFRPGNYDLNKNMSYDQIILAFRSGSNQAKAEKSLMFYEGMTLNEIADKLEEENICKKAELFAYLEAGDFPWEYRFLQEPLPETANRYLKYEGYFFPDTYIFNEDMTPAAVTQKFFSNLNGKLTDELYVQMKAKNLSLDETLTLASIIQKEAGKVKDMGGVSSVFNNRLGDVKNFPHLDSDVTSFYVAYDIMPALGEDVKDSKDKTYAGFENQKLYEAYDTYTCTGLPAGPICNPGLDAINAALNPDQTNYYFFVTDAEGNYYYAQTSAEHDQNVAVAMPKGDAHGTGVDAVNSASKAQ